MRLLGAGCLMPLTSPLSLALLLRGHDSSKRHGLTLLDPARPFPPYSPLGLLLNAQF